MASSNSGSLQAGSVMTSLLAVAVLLAAVLGVARTQEQHNQDEEVDDSGLASGLRVVTAAYRQCQHSGRLLDCLQLRALKAADRALRADRIPLLDGVELVRNHEAREAREDDLPRLDEETLSRDSSKLGTLLLDRAVRIFATHSVRINSTKLLSDEDYTEEGRGKKKLKKYGGLLLMAGVLKASLMALATKGVAVLTVAALVTGTVSLVLAAIVGFGTLLGSGGHGTTTYEIVKHPRVQHVKTHSSSHEYVGGYDDHDDEGGDYYESRAGMEHGSGGYHYYNNRNNNVEPITAKYYVRQVPDLSAHPLAYQRQHGALRAVVPSTAKP